MTDLLIRNVEESDVRGLDALAARLGISRSELLRREVTKLARRDLVKVTRADFERAAVLAADLMDEDVMRQAW